MHLPFSRLFSFCFVSLHRNHLKTIIHHFFPVTKCQIVEGFYFGSFVRCSSMNAFPDVSAHCSPGMLRGRSAARLLSKINQSRDSTAKPTMRKPCRKWKFHPTNRRAEITVQVISPSIHPDDVTLAPFSFRVNSLIKSHEFLFETTKPFSKWI